MINQQIQQHNDPSLLNLTTNEFMFALRVQQTDFIKNPYYNITLEQKIYTLLANGSRLQTSVPLDLEPCTLDHWEMIKDPNLNDTYKNLGLNDYLCVKKNQSILIGGQYESKMYQFLKFSVSKCNNVTHNSYYSWNPTCKSYADAQKFASQQSVRVQFQLSNFIINPNEPKNLIKSIIASDLFFQIQPEQMFTTADIFFTDYNIKTDNSVLFTEDIVEENFSVQQYGDFRAQYSMYSKDPTKPYSTFFFNRGRFSQYYNRSYMKLQDVLAQLGGFVNSMLAIAAIVVGFYNNQFYVLELANKFYDFDIIEENEKKKQSELFQQFKLIPSLRKNIHLPQQSPGKKKLSNNEQITKKYLEQMANSPQKQNAQKNEKDTKANQIQIEMNRIKEKQILNGSNRNETENNFLNTQTEFYQDISNLTNQMTKNKQIENLKNQILDSDSPKGNYSGNSDQQISMPAFSPYQNFERRLTTNEDEITNLMAGNNNNANNVNAFNFPIQQNSIENTLKSPLQQAIEFKINLPSIQEQENEQYSIQKIDLQSNSNSNHGDKSLKTSPIRQTKTTNQESQDYFFNPQSSIFSRMKKNNQEGVENELNTEEVEKIVIPEEQSDYQHKNNKNTNDFYFEKKCSGQLVEKEIGIFKQLQNQKKQSEQQIMETENTPRLSTLRDQHHQSERIPTCQYESSSYEEDEDSYEEDGEDEPKKVNQEAKFSNKKHDESEQTDSIYNERSAGADEEIGQIRNLKQVKSLSNIKNKADSVVGKSSNNIHSEQSIFKKQLYATKRKNQSLTHDSIRNIHDFDSINYDGQSRKSINTLNTIQMQNSQLLQLPNPSLPTTTSVNQFTAFERRRQQNMEKILSSPQRLQAPQLYLNTEQIQCDMASNHSNRSHHLSANHLDSHSQRQNSEIDSEDHSQNRQNCSLDYKSRKSPNQHHQQNFFNDKYDINSRGRSYGSPNKEIRSHSQAEIQQSSMKVINDYYRRQSTNTVGISQYLKRGQSTNITDTASSNLPHLGNRQESSQKRSSYIESKNRRSFITRELMKMNERRKKISYTFQYIVYKMTCQKFFRTKHNQMVDKAQSLITKDLDIIKILDKIQEIDRIKCLLLDYEQLVLFNYFPKPLVQISKEELLKLSNSPIENVYKKCAENLNTNQDIIKTVFKAKNKLKSLVAQKNKNNIQNIIDYSSYHEKGVDQLQRTYGINEYEQIYQAYKKISSKPNKTQTDNLLIELMGQELQNIFSQLEIVRNKKRTASRKFSFTMRSQPGQTSQQPSLSKQKSDPIKEEEKKQKQDSPSTMRLGYIRKGPLKTAEN